MTIRQRLGLIRQAFTTGIAETGRTGGRSSRARGGKRPYYQVAQTSFGNPWMYACIREISETLAAIPWFAADAEGKRLEAKDQRARLLARPSEGVTLSAWTRAWAVYLLMAGEVHGHMIVSNAESETARKRELLAIDLLEPTQILKRVNRDTGLINYRYRRRDNKVIDIPDEFRISWFMLDPIDKRHGHSAAGVVAGTSDSDDKARGLGEVMVEYGGKAGGIIQWRQDARPGPKQVEDLRADVNKMTSGERLGTIYALPPGAEYKEVGLTPREMDFPRLRQLNSVEMAAVFGIAPELIGSREAKYSNWQQAREAFHFDTIQPLAQTLQEGWQLGTEPYWQGALPRPDFSKVPALQGFFMRQIEAVKALVELGFSVNAAAERVGLGILIQDEELGRREREPLGQVTLPELEGPF